MTETMTATEIAIRDRLNLIDRWYDASAIAAIISLVLMAVGGPVVTTCYAVGMWMIVVGAIGVVTGLAVTKGLEGPHDRWLERLHQEFFHPQGA